MACRLPYGPDLPIHDHSSGPGAPDIELAFTPFFAADNGKRAPPKGTYGLTPVCALSVSPNSILISPHPQQGSILLKPESAGSIALRSADAYDAPLIDAK